MINFIRGIISLIGENYIILDCHDIGFYISMPSTALYRLSEGMEVTIYTHMAVREDDMSLFGFLNMEDLNMFRLLITVSGIGPKGALGILSAITVEELKLAIAAGDAKLIAGCKGIGLKTAQKMVVELKGKFKDVVPAVSSGSQKPSNDNVNTAILFVEATGVPRSQCMKALSKSDINENSDVDSIIDAIFKNLDI